MPTAANSIRPGSKGKRTIGLTAGASAPEELVRNVIEALRRLGDVEVSEMDGVEEKIEFRLPAELRNRTASDRGGGVVRWAFP